VRRGETLLKLANFPKTSIDDLLLRRGIDPQSIADAKAAIGLVGAPFSPADALNYSFQKHGAPAAYTIGRFGNGAWPVFYSALEKQTCELELRHHLGPTVRAVPHTRYFQFLACDFRGEFLDLRGKEEEHLNLISSTKSGYHFCQGVAQDAIASGVDGLLTPSARHRPNGVCTPVFSRSTMTNPRFIDDARTTI
jgi:hypothetical protein